MIKYNKPNFTGNELANIKKAYEFGVMSGDGKFTSDCQEILIKNTGAHQALLTHSCTAALEMSAFLSNLKKGDEVIMPSYTFVSTANAFVLRGATPVFVDIHPNTQNINPEEIKKAITKKTKAIVVVHYAGVACDMDPILEITNENSLLLIEDAAQGIYASHKDKQLGSIGDLGAYSFHETKNINCGEGGALLINKEKFINRAFVLWEKGTNRHNFNIGKISKYTWVDLGSSYLPGEITAAFLKAQLDNGYEVTQKRLKSWSIYNDELKKIEDNNNISLPHIPNYANHNGHIYYIKLKNENSRNKLKKYLNENSIMALTHYEPLHSSIAGIKYGKYFTDLKETNKTASTILRLPIFNDITEKEIHKVIDLVKKFIKNEK